MSIYDVYKIGGIGTVVMGRVESGTLRAYDSQLHVMHRSNFSEDLSTKSIEMQYEELPAATAGQLVGINIKNIAWRDILKGTVIGTPEDCPSVCEYFVAQIIVMNKKGMKVGYTPIIDCHQAHVPCRIVEIRSIVDKRTGNVIKNNPGRVKCNKSAIVCFKPLKRLFIERYCDYPGCGRFIMRDGNYVTGMGVVKSVVREMNRKIKKAINRSLVLSDVWITCVN
jgi:elongation factor 1-alpha